MTILDYILMLPKVIRNNDIYHGDNLTIFYDSNGIVGSGWYMGYESSYGECVDLDDNFTVPGWIFIDVLTDESVKTGVITLLQRLRDCKLLKED